MQPGLNNEFRVFFKPKKPESRNRRYIPVGVYSLAKYIGQKNADTVILKALSDKNDRYEKKFRTSGTVIVYKK